MYDVVTKITNTVKDINTGKTPVKMTDVRPPAFKAPSKGFSKSFQSPCKVPLKSFKVLLKAFYSPLKGL